MSDVTIEIGTYLGPLALFAPKVSPGATVWFFSRVQDVNVEFSEGSPLPNSTLPVGRWFPLKIPPKISSQYFKFHMVRGIDLIPLLLTVGIGEGGEIGDVGFSLEPEGPGFLVKARMWAPAGPLEIDFSNTSPFDAEVEVRGFTKKVPSGKSIEFSGLQLPSETGVSVSLVPQLGSGGGMETGGTTVIDIFPEPPPGP